MRGHRMKLLGTTFAGFLLVSAVAAADTGKPVDAGLESLARHKLSEAKVGDDVRVEVVNGNAVLKGTVEAVGRKERAEKEVAKIRGILSVMSHLSVAETTTPDADLLAHVGREIRAYPFYSIFDNVEVSALGGRVALTGQVTKPWYREDYGRLVSMISGVREVDNRLEVLPVSPMDDDIRRRVARAIYGEPALLRYGIQAYPPIHIIVKNGNVTLTGVVMTTLEKAMAERAARFAGVYFGLDNRLVVETELARARS